MNRVKPLLPLLSTFLFCLLTSLVATSQRIDQNIDLANSLKAKYGDKVNVVCLNSTITVTFNYSDSKKAQSAVTSCETIDESLISLKDDHPFVKAIYYNSENELVSDVKTYGKNNRSTDVFVTGGTAKDDDIFYSSEYYVAFSIPLSSLGEKVRYTANHFTEDLKYLDGITFPTSYPCEEKTIIFNVPKWLNIEFKEENFDGYDITKTVTQDPKTQNTIYTFTAKNIANYALDEDHVPNFFSMVPHILILSKSYTTPTGQTVDIINSMDDVYNMYETLVNKAGNKTDALKTLVTQLTQDKKTDIDKIKAIYYWVEDNIRYIAFENGIAGYKPSPCQDVYNNKYGDCKGMANLLTVMLKDAGFDARRTWIGVDGIPYDFSTPSLCLFNHCICTLVYNGKNYYLDGTEKYAPFGDNSDWIEGRQVLIENGNKYMEDKIPVEPVDRNKIEVDQDITLSGTDGIKGKEKDIYNGESKTYILNAYNLAPTSERNADMKQVAEGGNKDIEVSTPVTSDLTNREIPVTFAFDYTLKDQVNAFDNDVYVNIDNQKAFENLIIDSARYFDYRFTNRHDYVQTTNFTVPPGYKVKHMPDNLSIKKPNYSFIVTVTQKGNTVVYYKQLIISNTILKKKDFKTWNADLSQLKKVYDDQLILGKS